MARREEEERKGRTAARPRADRRPPSGAAARREVPRAAEVPGRRSLRPGGVLGRGPGVGAVLGANGAVWRRIGLGGHFIARRPVHGGHGAGAVQGLRGLAVGAVEVWLARAGARPS